MTARSIAWETSNCSVAVRFESLILVVPQPTSMHASSATTKTCIDRRPHALEPVLRTTTFIGMLSGAGELGRGG